MTKGLIVNRVQSAGCGCVAHVRAVKKGDAGAGRKPAMPLEVAVEQSLEKG